VPDVPFLQLELARRMLALGQPAPAAAILRRELERRPADASVAVDLTKAEMDMGRFVEARAAARRALNLDARDRQSRDRLVQINEVLALDPSQRGLTDPERFRRAQRLLARVHGDLLSCTATTTSSTTGTATAPPAAPDAAALSTAEILLEDQDASGPPISRPADVQKPADTTSSAATPVQAPASPSQSALSSSSPAPARTPPTVQERIDARLAAAEALWDARIARCGAVDGPLAWIFDRVAP
jgi:hypothetical protein